MEFNLAFIGFGTVGKGLMELLIEKEESLQQSFNFSYKIVAVHDLLLGTVIDTEDGLNGPEILDTVAREKSLKNHPRFSKGWDTKRVISETDAHIIIEVTPTDIKTGQPAISHVEWALLNQKHVVTTNKGPVALAYQPLKELADQNGVDFRFEGTVMSGTPVFHLCETGLAGANIHRIQGILNGTTNYILTQMEQGIPYETALKDAQEKGYAETVPDADVLGWDAKAKVLILANVLMGANLKETDIPCEGITHISLDDIASAKKSGQRWKLIGSVEQTEEGVSASVKPVRLPQDDFLAGISGVTNALSFETDALGTTTIIGPGAGKIETGFSLLTDILAINRKYNQ
ncbi:MAG: homoserine dehydrogenase [Calditrichaeota bacterium]|nr:homoserine dehydrogenase [Calditrichota bacterium]